MRFIHFTAFTALLLSVATAFDVDSFTFDPPIPAKKGMSVGWLADIGGPVLYVVHSRAVQDADVKISIKTGDYKLRLFEYPFTHEKPASSESLPISGGYECVMGGRGELDVSCAANGPNPNDVLLRSKFVATGRKTFVEMYVDVDGLPARFYAEPVSKWNVVYEFYTADTESVPIGKLKFVPFVGPGTFHVGDLFGRDKLESHDFFKTAPLPFDALKNSDKRGVSCSADLWAREIECKARVASNLRAEVRSRITFSE